MTKGVCSTSVQTQTDDSLNRLWPGLAGLGPAIHASRHMSCRFPWMPGTRPGKTICSELNHLNASEH